MLNHLDKALGTVSHLGGWSWYCLLNFIETTEHSNQPVESNHLNTLIINKNGFFKIGSYNEINEFTRFRAIGSGRELAFGAMHAVLGARPNRKRDCANGRGCRGGVWSILRASGPIACDFLAAICACSLKLDRLMRIMQPATSDSTWKPPVNRDPLASGIPAIPDSRSTQLFGLLEFTNTRYVIVMGFANLNR